MRCLSISIVSSLLFASSSAFGNAPEMPRPPANAVIVEGHAFKQKGEVFFTRPRAGAAVEVNRFGQYNDEIVAPDPAFVKWTQNTRQHLKPNDPIQEGDIIQTAGDGWVKLLLSDDSLLDIGPATLIQLKTFKGQGETRTVTFKLLYGKVRNVVTQPVGGPNKYQIFTPAALLGVRGTEYFVNAFPGKEGSAQTEVLCLHGQVSVDVAKHTERGLVYYQPVVVNPSTYFSTEGIRGLGQKLAVRLLSPEQVRDQVAKLSPQVNVFATPAGATPGPARLAGTGVRLEFDPQYKAPRAVAKNNPSSFDMDYPPGNRIIASPSGNFEIPKNFLTDPAAFGALPDPRRGTGPSPINQLPTTTSRVRVNLGNL